MKLAARSGVEFFDTANSYGNAEEIIGLLNKSDKTTCTRVISKLKPNIFSGGFVGIDKYKIIKQEIEKSLSKTNLKHLDGYLLHTPQYIYDEDVVSALKKCRADGLIRNFGVSIYDEEDALYAASVIGADYIQIPYSVFDQRLDRTEFFEIARRNGVKIFARSVFLQGLVFMNEEKIPFHLKDAKGYMKKFDKIISRHGFSRAQASLMFAINKPDIYRVVIGVDNTSQLIEDLEIERSGLDFKKCRDELVKEFKYIKNSIIFPSLWSKNKQ